MGRQVTSWCRWGASGRGRRQGAFATSARRRISRLPGISRPPWSRQVSPGRLRWPAKEPARSWLSRLCTRSWPLWALSAGVLGLAPCTGTGGGNRAAPQAVSRKRTSVPSAPKCALHVRRAPEPGAALPLFRDMKRRPIRWRSARADIRLRLGHHRLQRQHPPVLRRQRFDRAVQPGGEPLGGSRHAEAREVGAWQRIETVRREHRSLLPVTLRLVGQPRQDGAATSPRLLGTSAGRARALDLPPDRACLRRGARTARIVLTSAGHPRRTARRGS